METNGSPEEMVTLTAELVSAYVGNNAVPASELSALIATIHRSLISLGSPAASAPEPSRRQPPVPIKKSITPEHIISMEDGRPYKSLKRHLTVRGLTPHQYREKWGLPIDYPMVASAYAQRRSELAKASGLGRKPTAATGGPRSKGRGRKAG